MIKSTYESNDLLRKDLYEGDVFLLEAKQASKKLVEQVRVQLIEAFGADYRDYRHSLDNEGFFLKISKLRKSIYLDPQFQDLVRELIISYGFDPKQCLMDPARLRVIAHDGHHNPKAKPVYYAHRDTWYAHSQSLITWWVPLDDLCPDETFEFFPDYFNKSVPNNSEIFDYDDWIKDGWDLKDRLAKAERWSRGSIPFTYGDV